jgi:hypothetical protein
MTFVVFLSTSRQMQEEYLELSHDRFLPHPFQLIIHLSAFYSTLYSLIYWKGVLQWTTKETKLVCSSCKRSKQCDCFLDWIDSDRGNKKCLKVTEFAEIFLRLRSRGSSVSIVSGYGLDDRVIRFRSSAAAEVFPLASVSRPTLVTYIVVSSLVAHVPFNA